MRERKNNRTLVKVITIYLDLDNLGEIVKKKRLNEYKPNIITGQITNLILRFAWENNATIIFGLDEKRGTEEAILEIIGEYDLDKILEELDKLRKEVERIGIETKTNVTASIGVGVGYMPARIALKIRKRKEISNTPTRYLAKKALEKAKKEGKNKIIVLS